MLYIKDNQVGRGYRRRELGETLGQYDQYFNVRTDRWKPMTEKVDSRYIVGSDWATGSYRTPTNVFTNVWCFFVWAARQVTYWQERRKLKSQRL